MAGYANRVVNLEFRELSEDWETDPIRVVIRNPRLMPPGELQPREVPNGPDGTPDRDEANLAMYEVIAKLVIGWRVYDASELALDPETFEPLPQQLLPQGATVETVRKLPTLIVNRIAEQLTKAAQSTGGEKPAEAEAA